jgi:hypothetical protein
METKQFETELKQNIDMAIFSRLLETDYEENRVTSSTTLYTFVERAKRTVDEMEKAL